MQPVIEAFRLVCDPLVLGVVLASGLFGLFVGAVPGLTATMAVALLIPVTFVLPPLPAIACMVTATAMAIFAGDIPGALLRIPGTPASAAYCDEAHAMTRKGEVEIVLGAGLVFSVIGGLFGTVVLATLAPLFKIPGVRFVDLQYGDTAAERTELASSLGVTLQHVPDLDLFDDLDGLAALVAACDAVVTVSNTTAHLAGALGVPVSVLVPSGNGRLWYWGTGDRTGWYPSMRLYRQPAGGAWEPAVAAVAADLARDVVAPQSTAR